MSVASNATSGSQPTRLRGKKTPAQNMKAYTTLKLNGSKPGTRESASMAINITGSKNLLFNARTLARKLTD